MSYYFNCTGIPDSISALLNCYDAQNYFSSKNFLSESSVCASKAFLREITLCSICDLDGKLLHVGTSDSLTKVLSKSSLNDHDKLFSWSELSIQNESLTQVISNALQDKGHVVIDAPTNRLPFLAGFESLHAPIRPGGGHIFRVVGEECGNYIYAESPFVLGELHRPYGNHLGIGCIPKKELIAATRNSATFYTVTPNHNALIKHASKNLDKICRSFSSQFNAVTRNSSAFSISFGQKAYNAVIRHLNVTKLSPNKLVAEYDYYGVDNLTTLLDWQLTTIKNRRKHLLTCLANIRDHNPVIKTLRESVSTWIKISRACCVDPSSFDSENLSLVLSSLLDDAARQDQEIASIMSKILAKQD